MNDWHFPRDRDSKAHHDAPQWERGSSSTVGAEDPSVARSGSPPHQAQLPFFERLFAPMAVAQAWKRVQRNDGAPGVDGRRIADVAPVFHLEWPSIESSLRSGTWQPQPVRRVRIAKRGGGIRTLGIPAVMDRVVHQLIAQSLTALWEPRFSTRSFAYRSGRGVREALRSVTAQAGTMNSPWAWHLDIRQFFDCVPRIQALRAVRFVTDDKRLLQLVERILDAGAFERGHVVPTPHGLPQGSPLSPLLANAVLHPLDLWMAKETPGFMRYADDITILLPASAAGMPPLKEITDQLSALGLDLNAEKTQLSSLADAHCLGFSFWRDGSGRWRKRISPAAWAALEGELGKRRTLTWATLGIDEGTSQDYLTAWLAHFGSTECPRDHIRIAALRGSDSSGGVSTAKRVRLPYDGCTQTAPMPPQPSQSTPSGGSTSKRRLGRQTLFVWWTRLRVGRLVRIGLDMDRRRNQLLPRPRALRLTVLGFTLRLRL